ncbi:TetR/AcrR family transcriptional regulator [Thermodesulfobacteriota bacterium]
MPPLWKSATRNGKGGETIVQPKKKALSIKKDKEDAIIEAALKVMASKGFHKAKMSDITREAGISYGLIYHYFKNKEDLLEAIVDQYFDGIFRMINHITESDEDTEKKMQHFTMLLLDNFQQKPELINVMTSEVSRSTVIQTSKHQLRFRKLFSAVEEIILEGQEKGVVRSDFKARYLSYIFMGAIDTFISAMVLDNQRIKSDKQKKRIADGIYQIFMNGAIKR